MKTKTNINNDSQTHTITHTHTTLKMDTQKTQIRYTNPHTTKTSVRNAQDMRITKKRHLNYTIETQENNRNLKLFNAFRDTKKIIMHMKLK